MKQRIQKIVEILDEKKAEEIQAIDMSEQDYIAKYVVLATSLHGRHAMALTDELKEQLKPLGENFLGVEASDDWVVIDLGDILIHILSAEHRAKYNIEELLSKLKTKQE
ncbi:Ribosomal silencing factor RsfS [Campylobacter majalis]|uniref:Ribosomal silencing factor RsfS n=1 Tax=Campylobacter majalis TaxID=2790656 RepID=A0ABM8Q963_9BACT|nr:ribosome silencing factor [Campylobacter majalis]CAD7289405.1 Ribosomal silencing factor RsfS [Campylobacter majalis]